jgi:hypothetical protein
VRAPYPFGMSALPSIGDTIRDVEASDDVRALLGRIADGEPVERSVLVAELERMLRLVHRTDAAFNRAALLLLEGELIADPELVAEVTTLPDGTQIVVTRWLLGAREKIATWLDRYAVIRTEPRSIPCFPLSQLEIARSARSYDDAVYLLGESLEFV